MGTDVAERSGAGVEVGEEEKWRETEREKGCCGGPKGVWVRWGRCHGCRGWCYFFSSCPSTFGSRIRICKLKIKNKKLKEVAKTQHVYTQVSEESNDVFSTLVFCTKTLPKFYWYNYFAHDNFGILKVNGDNTANLFFVFVIIRVSFAFLHPCCTKKRICLQKNRWSYSVTSNYVAQ